MRYTMLGAPVVVLGTLALASLHAAWSAGVHADLHGKTAATALLTKTQAGVETLGRVEAATLHAHGANQLQTHDPRQSSAGAGWGLNAKDLARWATAWRTMQRR